MVGDGPADSLKFPLSSGSSKTCPPECRSIVEGGNRLTGSIRPSGNKNAALPIVAAALLTDEPVTLENVPRIRDLETLVELVKTTGAQAEWTDRNTLRIHAKTVNATSLDPAMCARSNT